LVAPSGYVPDARAVVERIESYLDSRGSRLVVDPTALGCWSRFSAPDAERAEAIHRMASHADVDIVLAIRGGYGASRILDRVDYSLLRETGKLFAGHSDFTALSLALLARAGCASLAGPSGAHDFGCERVDPFTEAHFWGVLGSPVHELSVNAEQQVEGEFEGVLWGGNLSLVCHLVGTRYLPAIEGGVLVLEDVNEHPYRVERMLLQLLHARVLEKQALIVLGDFSGATLSEYDNGFGFPSVVADLAARLPVPVIGGLPFGHLRAKLTLPIGARAAVSVDRSGYRLRFAGHRWFRLPAPAGAPA
jgi:muramoyltetrapeptide carboxypeptidase